MSLRVLHRLAGLGCFATAAFCALLAIECFKQSSPGNGLVCAALVAVNLFVGGWHVDREVDLGEK